MRDRKLQRAENYCKKVLEDDHFSKYDKKIASKELDKIREMAKQEQEERNEELYKG